METLGYEVVQRSIDEGALGDWRAMAQCLAARFRAPGPDGLAAVARFAVEVAEVVADGVVPEIDLRSGTVGIALYAVDADGERWITEDVVRTASAASDTAERHGLTAVPEDVVQLELGLDTHDRAAVAPFWSALLTGDAGNRTDVAVYDPDGRVPPLWFQRTTEHPTPRQRWHLDVWLAPEVVESRIAAACAAGGTVVDSSEDSFTVLADPDGNRACICIATGRT